MTRELTGPVLVTGASGFIGACAARALVRRGQPVHLLLRDPQRAWRLRDLLGMCGVHHGDLRDRAAVRGCINAARPQVILHCATHGAYEAQSDAGEILSTNILGTQNLFEIASGAGVSLVVQTGSSSEYGCKSAPMCENDRLEPNSVYAVAKAAQTHLGQLLAKQGKLQVATLRLFSVYGPYEEATRLIPTLLRRAASGMPLELADPDTARDFVFIDDVISALVDFENLRHIVGDVVNLGSGRESTLRDVVAEMTRIFGSRSEVRWNAFPARRWDTTHWSANTQKSRDLLGWSPRHSLAQGLLKTSEWMRITGGEDADAQTRPQARRIAG